MYIKETQLITLEFPKEAYLLKDFQNNKDWKELGIGTVGATFEKVVKEGFFEIKEQK